MTAWWPKSVTKNTPLPKRFMPPCICRYPAKTIPRTCSEVTRAAAAQREISRAWESRGAILWGGRSRGSHAGPADSLPDGVDIKRIRGVIRLIQGQLGIDGNAEALPDDPGKSGPRERGLQGLEIPAEEVFAAL